MLTDNFQIAEYSSTYLGRIQGSSKVKLADIVEGGMALLDISYRYHIGRFALAGGAADAPLTAG